MARKKVHPLITLYGKDALEEASKTLPIGEGYYSELIEHFVILDARSMVKGSQDKKPLKQLIDDNIARVDAYKGEYAQAFMDLIIEAQKE